MAEQSDTALTVGLPISSFLPSLGGAEVGLHNIASRLADRGHHPIVMASASHARELNRLNWKPGYRVVAFPPKIWGILKRFPPIGYAILDLVYANWQRRFGIDVWHATFGYPVGVSLIHYSRRTRTPAPHLVRCVGDDIQVVPEIGYGMRLDPGIDSQIRQWLPRADRLSAITESVASEYRQLGVPDEKILRIPNGVDVNRFATKAKAINIRKMLGIGDERFLFLSVGRNHSKKKFSDTIHALALLKGETGNDLCPALLLAGKGVSELQSESERLGLDGDVFFYDPSRAFSGLKGPPQLPSDDILACYQAADCFLMSSLVETFGIVTIEAMAARLAIISTDAPGCVDVVRNGKDGLVYPVGDISALATHMHAVFRDDDLRSDLQERAICRARDFNWERIVDQYIEAYRTLIDQAAPQHVE